MSENSAALADMGGAGATPPPAVTSEDFTPGELAYFESRGADVSGLAVRPDTSNSPPGRGDAPAASNSEPAATPVDVEAPPESVNPDDVTIGADGKARTKDGKFVKYVPHSVFHAKNEKLKTIAAELQAERERFARADERLQILNGALAASARDGDPAAQQPDPSAPIDPEKDLFGAFRQAASRIKELEAKIAATNNSLKADGEGRARVETFKADALQFMQQAPDFEDAVKHLIAGAHAELEINGVANQAEREQHISRTVNNLVENAKKQGKNAASVIYSLAKTRGYTARQVAAAIDPSKSPAAQALEAANKGQAAAVSLNGAGGAPADNVDLIALANMSEDAFYAYQKNYVARHGKAAWEKLF